MTMFNRKHWLATAGCVALLLAMAWAWPQAAAAQGRIAVVDVDRAAKSCKQGKRAMVSLQRKAQKFETELKALQAKINKQRKDLENTAMLLKPEARMSKQRELERLMRRFMEKQRDAEQEMRDARREAFSPILRNLKKIITQIGASGKFALIVEAKTAIYYPQSADITSRVIAAYDKAHP